MQKIINKTAL